MLMPRDDKSLPFDRIRACVASFLIPPERGGVGSRSGAGEATAHARTQKLLARRLALVLIPWSTSVLF